jgi:hypothetical protein
MNHEGTKNTKRRSWVGNVVPKPIQLKREPGQASPAE